MTPGGTRGERGFTVIAAALSMLGIIAMLGMSIDLGRAFITRNEAQTFTDSAALSAANSLNGTLQGITAAQDAVANNANTWTMATRSFTGVTTEFSTDRVNWVAAPTTGAQYRFVRVTAPSNSITIFFLTLVGAPTSMQIAARSVAGIFPPTTFAQGVFPFAPIAHNNAAPNFGYLKGDELTLLWPSSVGSNGNVKMNNLCQSDRSQAALNAVQAGTTSDRGYIQDTSASAIASAIEDDHMDYTVTLSQPVSRNGGIKSTDVTQSLANRVAQDSDPNTDRYDSYVAAHNSGPMRRVVVVPIVGDAVNSVVLGFANVFLPSSQPHNPNDAKCAIYIAPITDPGGASLANGANIVRLIQ
jgi:Flp pilus assembly protein TadG